MVRRFAVAACLTASFLFAADYDIVIRNARIVDGTGNPWFRADVGMGIRLDDLGLYVAKSVTDPRTPVNFFARLQPRF